MGVAAASAVAVKLVGGMFRWGIPRQILGHVGVEYLERDVVDTGVFPKAPLCHRRRVLETKPTEPDVRNFNMSTSVCIATRTWIEDATADS